MASKNQKCATNCATINITRTNVAIKCLTFRWSDIAKIGEVRFSYAPQKSLKVRNESLANKVKDFSFIKQ